MEEKEKRSIPIQLDLLPKKEDILIPASSINASQYCRRLAYLQFIHQERKETSDTIKGKRVHNRVDKSNSLLPSPEELIDNNKKIQSRSVTLSSERLNLISRMDLLESENGFIVPIEYKKGSLPRNRESEELLPEEAQLATQALILKDNGYLCEKGMIYYAESEKRVIVNFNKDLFEKTKKIIDQFKEDIKSSSSPKPLKDSAKCPRCSLVEICLPDEFHYIEQQKTKKIRPISLKSESKFPVYVQAYRGQISKKGYRLEIKTDEEEIKSVPIMDISQLVLMGNVSISTPCLHELMNREIPVSWHSYSGWFLGISQGIGHKNSSLREAQYRKSFDKDFCLKFAKSLVKAKIYNCRTLIRRNWRGTHKPENLLMILKKYAEKTNLAKNIQELLGIEGYSAHEYFQSFHLMIKNKESYPFHFTKRSRRPPEDPINLMLSFSYSLLTRLWTVTLSSTGFDAFRGFYHQSKYGRPALALDMMEPFRPLICDSTVLLAVNNKEIQEKDFIYNAGKVGWKPEGKKKFISVFERRLSQKIKHPVFKYEVSYRQLLEAQSRLLVRYLFDEIKEYPHIITR
ncbi:MAG: CRISPR-associated endonuclease Cas1 [Bdellovibrionales bacterium]|nr:CRISPR-associated endonuclease Cas1 [Bdellovibrionales bacterium]